MTARFDSVEARKGLEMDQERSSLLFRVAVAILAMVTPLIAAAYQRPDFKPGFNLFAAKQDVQFGRESAQEVDQQFPLLKDPEVLRYINDLGKYLATFAPNQQGLHYPWQFKVVNSTEINAFALPGGFIYINRGAIVAAQNEAEIAGVIAHEEGHVVMRHGTHRASEIMLAQAPLVILEGFFGQSSSLTNQFAQLGLSFGVNSLLLKNSRTMESQADQVGTYILYEAGYDPYAMADFFQIIQKKYPQQTIQFFSDHPNPGNRIQAVDQEVPSLGPRKQWKTDSPAFEFIKRRLESLPAPPQPRQAARGQMTPAGPPPAPSEHMKKYTSENFSIYYPDNWTAEASDAGVTFAPPGGRTPTSDGTEAQGYGASISIYQPRSGGSDWGLVEATNQLVKALRKSNPGMRVLGQRAFNLRGQPAISTQLEGNSSLGPQKENDRLITLRQGSSLLALIFISPTSALSSYLSTFAEMLDSFQPH